MTKKQCPLGEDCDLTTAWMAGAAEARDRAKARIEELEKKAERLGREINVARYGQPDFAWSVHKAAMADLEAKLAKAVQHIEWFISEDETNRGDEPMPERRGKTWNEINAYWIEHLDSAIAFVAELKGDKP